MSQVRDGLSNTIMTVEVSDWKAVIWTKPDDFVYDEKEPLKGLIGLHAGGFNAGLADGSVRFIRKTINPETLKALFMRDDGQMVELERSGMTRATVVLDSALTLTLSQREMGRTTAGRKPSP